MSALAHATAENRLQIKMLGVDDHKKELRPATAAARQTHFVHSTFDTATQWARAARRASDNSVLIADNRMEALDNLASVGHPDIETDGGNNAGIKLLTDFCDREQIKAGLKIVLTAFSMNSHEKHAIERRNKRINDNIIIVYKNHEDIDNYLLGIFSDYYNICYMKFIKQKFDFVSATMEEWELSDKEKSVLLGVRSTDDEFVLAMQSGNTTAVDAETRCDLIYRLRTNLELLFGDDLSLQSKWLRTRLRPLENRSPIEFLSTGYQYSLAELIDKLEGP